MASQVGLWGLLELLGRVLLEMEKMPTFPKVGIFPAPANLAADPLWAVLATLDGRQSGEPAGANFTGPDHIQIPALWERWLGCDFIAGWRVDLTGVAPLDGSLLAGVSALCMCCWLAALTPLIGQMLAAALGDGHDPAAHLLLRRGPSFT